jgi:hypothetical protein
MQAGGILWQLRQVQGAGSQVCDNVPGKRVSQASEWVKILHIPPSTINYASNIKDIETKQIAL